MTNNTEIWAPARYLKANGELVYFEGVEVSSFGRVRHISDGYEYKQQDCHGYLKWWKGLVHRLVLSSFTDNIDGSLQVNHIDENKHNNRLENLEWMTPKENSNHGTRNERVSAAHKGNTNMKGKHHSDETKRKISELRKGKSSNTKGKHWKLVDGKHIYY